VLHNFSWDNTNADGKYPNNYQLVLSSNTLFGTTAFGGWASPPYGGGTIFKINTDGTGYTNLYVFPDNSSVGGLLLNSNLLYGAATLGGNNGGTLYQINPDGTGFTALFNFTNDSACSLILSSNRMYGIDGGGVFCVNLDGTGFTNIFYWPSQATDYDQTGLPIEFSSLTLSGNVFYVPAWYPTNECRTVSVVAPCRPVINNLTLTNKQAVLSCSGFAGGNYWMQSTSDFSTWQTIATNMADTNGNWSCTDSVAGSVSLRLYRAVAEP
jgi:uncharacterized repeat protein (TIGR03803 family)